MSRRDWGRTQSVIHLFSHSTLEQTTRTSSPRADSTSGQHPGHPHASQAAASPTYLSRHLSAFASRMQVLDQQIELIVTASVGLVWSGQHLEHNAQRQEAPTRTTAYMYSDITIEGKQISSPRVSRLLCFFVFFAIEKVSVT